jgi:hypothetical protein
MNRSFYNHLGRQSLVATVAAGAVLVATSVGAWWGPPPYAGVWDPWEAYLQEYDFLDPHGPSRGDIKRMHRDNWKAIRGYPIYIDGVGPHGPTHSDVRRQLKRKERRMWGYPY